MSLIACVSGKGGQGKSSLSTAIALACGGALITNEEDSDLDRVLEEGRVLRIHDDADLPTIRKGVLAIYDGAKGLHQQSTKQAIEKADHVLIPVKLDGNGSEELKRLSWGLRKFSKLNMREASVVVMTNPEKDYLEIRERIETDFPRIKVFWIPRSILIQNMNQDGESLYEKAKQKGSQSARLRKEILPRFEQLLDHINLTPQ